MRLKFTYIIFYLLGMIQFVNAQTNDKSLKFDKTIDSLGQIVLENTNAKSRDSATTEIITLWKDNLVDSNSFHHLMTTVKTISVLYPSDSSFRIITGQHFINDNEYRYYGGIQLANGKFIPLHDKSYEIRAAQEDNVLLDKDNWYGALYYKMFDCQWRNFAYETAKVIKNRSGQTDAFDHIADLLSEVGKREVRFFKDLAKIKL